MSDSEMEEPEYTVGAYELINTLNEIQSLFATCDSIAKTKPYASSAIGEIYDDMQSYHANLKLMTEVIQQLEPVMQNYRDKGYKINCDRDEYYTHNEWQFKIIYRFETDLSNNFEIIIYVKSAKTNAVETNVKLQQGSVCWYSYMQLVAKMSIDKFRKSKSKYDKLINDIITLLIKYPTLASRYEEPFKTQYKKLKM